MKKFANVYLTVTLHREERKILANKIETYYTSTTSRTNNIDKSISAHFKNAQLRVKIPTIQIKYCA